MKNALIAAVVAVVVVVLAYMFFPPVTNVVDQTFGATSQQVTDGNCFLSPEGVHICPTKRPLTTATTTACAIRSPSATSTLVRTVVQVTTATSTATVWSPSKATTAFATTTLLGPSTFSLSSAILGTMFVNATSSAATVDSNWIFAPNSWVVWGVAGVDNIGADSTKLKGFCSATFEF